MSMRAITRSGTAMNFVTFNQDYSCLAVATTKGFRLYNIDPFSKYFTSEEENVSIIEMLFATSLVALVGSPRHLTITNTKRSTIICELTFPSAILAVKLNRKRLAVVLEEQIYLYDISNMNLLHIIETSPNPAAICALSPSSDNCHLVFPKPKPQDLTAAKKPAHAPPGPGYVPPTSGEVQIFDTLTLREANVVLAHKSPLSCVALNSTGTILATASETGTIIRIFTVPNGDKLYQFRRGTYPSTIYSMSFNVSSTLLCVSSTTDTVHIFRLGAPPPASTRPFSPPQSPSDRGRAKSYSSAGESMSDGPEDSVARLPPAPTRKSSGTFGSMIRRTSQMMGGKVADVVGGYLPQSVTEMWEPVRDFAYIKIPKSGNESSGFLKSVVAMSSSSPQVIIVTSDGGYYVFNIDMDAGGEGVLVKQYSVSALDDKLGMSGSEY